MKITTKKFNKSLGFTEKSTKFVKVETKGKGAKDSSKKKARLKNQIENAEVINNYTAKLYERVAKRQLAKQKRKNKRAKIQSKARNK